MKNYYCVICKEGTSTPRSQDLGQIKGNTTRFKDQLFTLWQCPKCLTIHSVDEVDFADIYSDYPLSRQRSLDSFARNSLSNLWHRILPYGVNLNSSILDYGCGNGVFIEFLRNSGCTNVAGYDPYVPQFRNLETKKYDLVVANDVIEHAEDPSALLIQAISLVKPNGLLYLGTADSKGVESMKDLEKHAMRLHQPFHRKIITQKTLLELGKQAKLTILKTFRRSYMDTLKPFCNYRFLDEFNSVLGHNLDIALDPKAGPPAISKNPRLIFYALFGYFLPSAIEPAVLWRVK